MSEETSAPNSFHWPNALAGTYSLTARASDNANEITILNAIGITLNTESNQYAGWSTFTNGTDFGRLTVHKTSTTNWGLIAYAAQELVSGDSSH